MNASEAPRPRIVVIADDIKIVRDLDFRRPIAARTEPGQTLDLRRLRWSGFVPPARKSAKRAV